MQDPVPGHSVIELLSLHEIRQYLRRSHSVGLAVLIGLSYALGSMLLGGMLVFARYSGGYSLTLYWGNDLGIQSWNYPGLLVEAPWGFVELPFFATLAMVVVSAGVGLGMAVAILLGVRLVRDRKVEAGRPVATGTVAGLTPAMIALVTLGACCSVTAGATAGVGLVAQASGSTTSNLLLNNWYLGVFQIAVVYVALVAQEMLLRVYGGLLAPPSGSPRLPAGAPIRKVDRHALAAGALRCGLLAGGVTWSLAVVAQWTTVGPSAANAALWFSWVVQHWLVSGVAILAALFPEALANWSRAMVSTTAGFVLRVFLAVGAFTLAVWVPPPLAGQGLEGFGNELLGLLGASAGLGAVQPVFGWGVALALRWTFQYLLLGGFAAAVSWSPRAVLSWVGSPGLSAAGRTMAPGPVSTPSPPSADAR